MLSEKPPLLTHPEVAKEPDKYKCALEAEQLAYKYKFTREAMLSIYDEAKKYLNLENIEDYIKSNPDSKLAKQYEIFYREPAHKTFNIKHREKGEYQVEFSREKNFSDFFRHLWMTSNQEFNNVDGDGTNDQSLLLDELNEVLFEGIEKDVKKKFNEPKDRKEKREYQEMINNITAGKGIRLSTLLSAEYTTLSENLDEIVSDSNNVEKIKTYHQEMLPRIKKDMRNILDAKKNIKIVKQAKTDESIVTNEEITSRHSINLKKTELLRRRQEKAMKKVLGFDVKLGIQKAINEVGTSINQDFISAYVNYHHEMKHIYLMLEKGEIVETDDVKKNIETAMGALTKNPPTIVYMHGDFGTGKTALAKHISKTRFGKEPEIVAGHKFLEPDALTEEFKISQQTLEEKFLSLSKQIHPDKANQAQLTGLDTDEIFQEITKMRSQLRDKIVSNIAAEEENITVRENGVEKKRSLRAIISNWNEFYRKNEIKDDSGNIYHITPDSLLTKESIIHAQKFIDRLGFDQMLILPKELEQNMNREIIKSEITDDIDKSLDILFSNQVQGRYVLNAMYRAMLEGRPLIIDEANAISPDVLIAFNDLLTKKIGDKIQSKSIGEFIIKNGYCIMWTGNTGERYHQARFNDIDPATYSRILPIHVQYLPQSTPTALGDSFKRLQLSKIADQFKNLSEDKMYQEIIDSKEAAKQDQIFQVLMLKLLNNRTGCWLTVPENDRYRVFKDIYKLSYASKLIMNLFEANISSQEAQKLYDLPVVKKILGSQDPEVLVQTLQKTNLTMRELIDNIIGGYLDENGRMDIEYYAFKFVKKLNLTPKEQVIVYALLKRAGFFDISDGWPDYASAKITDAKTFNKQIDLFDPTTEVKKYTKIRKNGEVVDILNTEGQYHLEYFTSLETLQMFFGYLPPTKPEDYNQLQAKQFEATEDKERGKWTEKFLKTLAKFDDSVYPLMTSETEINDFTNEKNKLREEGKKLTGEAYLDNIKQRYDFLIKIMNDKKMISEAEYSKTAKMSLEEVDKFINNILDKKENQ